MVFHGTRYGVTMFPGGRVQWFTDYNAAELAEEQEIKKFVARDYRPSAPHTYTISLVKNPPKATRKGGEAA